MYEVELKARIKDRKTVISTLESFASYCGAVEKSDTYYENAGTASPVKVRLRKEIPFDSEEIACSSQKNKILSPPAVIFTYKKKELKSNSRQIEINNENECILSDPSPVELFLNDAGFVPVLKKQKRVLSWKYQDALFELCTVMPLGDFLEIEILLDESVKTPAKITETQDKLISLLKKCGLQESDIEKKYYSQLLNEFSSTDSISS